MVWVNRSLFGFQIDTCKGMWITHTGHFLYVIKMLTIISFRFFLSLFSFFTHYHILMHFGRCLKCRRMCCYEIEHLYDTRISLSLSLSLTYSFCFYCICMCVCLSSAVCYFVSFTFNYTFNLCAKTLHRWNFKQIPQIIYCATNTYIRTHMIQQS